MGIAAVRPVDRESWPALEDLFGRAGASNGCWCMYWILGASYHRRARELNKQQLRSAAFAGAATGLLAFDDEGTAQGWCRLSPRSELPWLEHRFPAIDDQEVWSVPCFFVRRGARDQGVMAALIDGAVEWARRSGARVLEVYPVDTAVPGATRNLFPGTASAFTRAGFTVVAHRAADRPIMRRLIAPIDARARRA